MEIEKKFRIKNIPGSLDAYEKKEMEQGYLCSNPIIRIRKSNADYILTYKSRFGIEDNANSTAKICNEVEVPLNAEGYEHLKEKVDSQMVMKNRYIIPLENGLKAELDIFEGYLKGLIFVEVEFPSEEMAESFTPPSWFGQDVSLDSRYSNHYLSTIAEWKEEDSN